MFFFFLFFFFNFSFANQSIKDPDLDMPYPFAQKGKAASAPQLNDLISNPLAAQKSSSFSQLPPQPTYSPSAVRGAGMEMMEMVVPRRGEGSGTGSNIVTTYTDV
jgi:hypothetical protein